MNDVEWVKWQRPGYFGRRRDEKVAELDSRFGPGNWKLSHVLQGTFFEEPYDFERACSLFYEESYFRHLKDRPDLINAICSYGECYDNAVSNVRSGLSYTAQEAYSTHIQDIAIRNVLHRLGRKFEGPSDTLLQIRHGFSELGDLLGPGTVPFMWPEKIHQPSLAPKWASKGSVEDFWQSNKWLMLTRDVARQWGYKEEA